MNTALKSQYLKNTINGLDESAAFQAACIGANMTADDKLFADLKADTDVADYNEREMSLTASIRYVNNPDR